MTESNIKKVALVGGGVIGGGWATRCLANGLQTDAVSVEFKHGKRNSSTRQGVQHCGCEPGG